MNLHTEKEHVNQNQHFAFRMRNLYTRDIRSFRQVQDYLPAIYFNERKSLKYKFFNEALLSKAKEIEDLYFYGRTYLDKVSDPYIQRIADKKVSEFNKLNCYNSTCEYVQVLSINGTMTPFFTNKVFVEDDLSLNTFVSIQDFGILKKLFKEIIPWGKESYTNWLRFQTLTKREKQILGLLAKGLSNKNISDQLFIAVTTVQVHRKSIYSKLEVNSAARLVNFAALLHIY